MGRHTLESPQETPFLFLGPRRFAQRSTTFPRRFLVRAGRKCILRSGRQDGCRLGGVGRRARVRLFVRVQSGGGPGRAVAGRQVVLVAVERVRLGIGGGCLRGMGVLLLYGWPVDKGGKPGWLGLDLGRWRGRRGSRGNKGGRRGAHV